MTPPKDNTNNIRNHLKAPLSWRIDFLVTTRTWSVRKHEFSLVLRYNVRMMSCLSPWWSWIIWSIWAAALLEICLLYVTKNIATLWFWGFCGSLAPSFSRKEKKIENAWYDLWLQKSLTPNITQGFSLANELKGFHMISWCLSGTIRHKGPSSRCQLAAKNWAMWKCHVTLPETNIAAPENWWLEDETSSWECLFSGARLALERV